jgi:hypothetical protein
MTYIIHDNGSEPFTVEDLKSQKKIIVFKNEYDEEDKAVKDKELFSITYLKIMVGDNLLKDKHYAIGVGKGNSLLLQLTTTKWMFIGYEIYTFEPYENDKIQKFYSPIGNNDFPYPYAVGEKYVYFFWDNSFFPVELFNLKEDASQQLVKYTITPFHEKSSAYLDMRKKFSKGHRKLKVKMIHKRRWW